MDNNIHSSVLAYVQHNHPQFLKNACIQAFNDKKYNVCAYLVYSSIYEKSSEDILHEVDPDLIIMYGKSLKKIRG